MPNRKLVRGFTHQREEVFLQPSGRHLVRVNPAGRDKAREWLENHPWRNHAYWVQYASQYRENSADEFITKCVRWLNKTTVVKSESGLIKGVRTPLVAVLCVGLEGDHPQDPRTHAHAVILTKENLSTKAIQKRYTAGYSSIRRYDHDQDGIGYALDHHHLVVEAAGFQPRHSKSPLTNADLRKLTLHHELGW